MIVMREMDADGVEQVEVQDELTVERVEYLTEAPTSSDVISDQREQQQDQDSEEVEEDAAAEATSTPQPSHGCNCRTCWRGCKKRGYNWGICLWKKCHCYY